VLTDTFDEDGGDMLRGTGLGFWCSSGVSSAWFRARWSRPGS